MKCLGLHIFVAIILCVCARAHAPASNGCYHIEIGQVGSAPVYQDGVFATVWQSVWISVRYNSVIIPAANHIVSAVSDPSVYARHPLCAHHFLFCSKTKLQIAEDVCLL